MPEEIWLDLLRVSEALVLVFGGIIVFYAMKSGRRSRSPTMFLLGLGFAFVVAGGVAAGFLFELNGLDVVAVELLQSASQAVGFVIIAYSLMIAKE